MPRRLDIEAIGLHTTIIPEQTESDGEIPVPQKDKAGWWSADERNTPAFLPGEPGPVVIFGHNSPTGNGVFSRLPELPLGTRVTISDGQGRTKTYRAIKKHRYPMLRIVHGQAVLLSGPVEHLFAPTNGGHVLRLATCVGTFYRRVGGRYVRHFGHQLVVTFEEVEQETVVESASRQKPGTIRIAHR